MKLATVSIVIVHRSVLCGGLVPQHQIGLFPAHSHRLHFVDVTEKLGQQAAIAVAASIMQIVHNISSDYRSSEVIDEQRRLPTV